MMVSFKNCVLPCIKLFTTSDSDDCLLKSILEPVQLNVYDLYKLNEFTSNFGFGIFHSGVEVYGKEYAFGGHPYAVSGIFTMTPKNTQQLADFFNMDYSKIRFRQSITIGHTYLSHRDVKRLIRGKLARKFQGRKYHLLTNNCNHFSDKFTKQLCNKNIPGWVNRLAHFSAVLPFVDKCLPIEWTKPFSPETQLVEEQCINRGINDYPNKY